MEGKPEKSIFISRRGAYHGSTVAAASLGGFSSMHKQGGLPIDGIYHGPSPDWWSFGGDLSPEDFGRKVAEQTLALIDGIGASRIGAMIAEPIMGAGGVIIPPKTYWPILAKGLKERDILLISDEVICGFGRTGQWFGCEFMGTEPDFMTMAKGITSGYVPMGAVAVSDRVANVLKEKGDEFATATPIPAIRRPAPHRSPRSGSCAPKSWSRTSARTLAPISRKSGCSWPSIRWWARRSWKA